MNGSLGSRGGSLRVNCEGAQRCQRMKPPYELDERVVVDETVGLHYVEGHRQPNGDGPLPMPLRLMLNGEGNEIGKVEDVPVPQRCRESRCLGAARIVRSRAKGKGIPASRRRMIDVEIKSVELILLHELFCIKAQCGTELWAAQLAD
ncbi:hypothetical protein GOBAR_AA04689 [Gossypium barbadense]|uniref:Uncharacterized protein n=1 Tax=Gossypium barbadense TaxID=3634 RepID=A0A2P5YK20_GOSBA|nr:hypothetical protein GOBAR_AA04689 [Gossypium barbadense]